MTLDTYGQASTINFIGVGTLAWPKVGGMLRGGDLTPPAATTGDNGVTGQDYTILKYAWGPDDPIADIDGDGAVYTLDYGLMKANFGKTGDEE